MFVSKNQLVYSTNSKTYGRPRTEVSQSRYKYNILYVAAVLTNLMNTSEVITISMDYDSSSNKEVGVIPPILFLQIIKSERQIGRLGMADIRRIYG